MRGYGWLPAPRPTSKVPFSVLPSPVPVELVESSLLPEPVPTAWCRSRCCRNRRRGCGPVLGVATAAGCRRRWSGRRGACREPVPRGCGPVLGVATDRSCPARAAIGRCRWPSPRRRSVGRPPDLRRSPQPARPSSARRQHGRPSRSVPAPSRTSKVARRALRRRARSVERRGRPRPRPGDDDDDVETAVPTPSAVAQTTIPVPDVCGGAGDRGVGRDCGDHGGRADVSRRPRRRSPATTAPATHDRRPGRARRRTPRRCPAPHSSAESAMT